MINVPKKDKTGYRQGILTVVEFSHYKQYKSTKVAYWKCRCECGNLTTIAASRLRGNQYSCGCRRGGKGLKRNQKQIIPPKRKRKPWGQTAMQDVRASYQRRAKKKNLVFKLSSEVFWKLIQANCHYCKNGPNQIIKGREERSSGRKWYGTKDLIYNGIDRIDSSKGYIESNCVTCCKKCNYMKRDLSLEEFRSHIFKLALSFQSDERK